MESDCEVDLSSCNHVRLLTILGGFPTTSLLFHCLSKYKILKVSREFALLFKAEEKTVIQVCLQTLLLGQ